MDLLILNGSKKSQLVYPILSQVQVPNSPDVIIREVVPADAASLRHLFVMLAVDLVSGGAKAEPADGGVKLTVEDIAKHIKEHKMHAQVAIDKADKDKLVGYAVYYYAASSDHGEVPNSIWDLGGGDVNLKNGKIPNMI
jgi:hypothetical protein